MMRDFMQYVNITDCLNVVNNTHVYTNTNSNNLKVIFSPITILIDLILIYTWNVYVPVFAGVATNYLL